MRLPSHPQSATTRVPPDPSRALEIIDGMRLSKAVFAALELDVFEMLEGAPHTAAACAERLGLNADALERLLNACAAAGVLVKADGRYSNTELASVYIRRSSPATLAGYMLYANRVTWRLWEHLEDAVREGTPRWSQTFSAQEGIFDHFFASEDAKEVFLSGMHGMGMLSSPSIAASFDLSGHRAAADLGGGTGHLVAAICERYPSIEGIVFDLPGVAPVTRARLAAAGFNGRVRVEEGDFFRDPLPAADLYCLGRILHDWSEAKIRSLLGKIHTALPEGGAILLAELLLDEEKTAPLSGLLQSLNMLACTEGKERSLAEYRALLESEGFRDVQGHVTGGPVDAVYARRA
ncbi:MAG: homocysteine methyltransferase [Bryobacterales bacterium]|nr:homocysteine methyltransferase [Bryobacterales bacterium]